MKFLLAVLILSLGVSSCGHSAKKPPGVWIRIVDDLPDRIDDTRLDPDVRQLYDRIVQRSIQPSDYQLLTSSFVHADKFDRLGLNTLA